jgi:branched-chain amino acid transport system substrate-binding protein
VQRYMPVAIALVFTTVLVSGPVYSADKIKVGFFSILEGPYTALGEDGQRGFDLAVMQHNGKAGGKDLELIRGYSDASPDSALRAAKKLVEQDKVDILIAPLSGSEGIALRDHAKTQPQVTSMTTMTFTKKEAPKQRSTTLSNTGMADRSRSFAVSSR